LPVGAPITATARVRYREGIFISIIYMFDAPSFLRGGRNINGASLQTAFSGINACQVSSAGKIRGGARKQPRGFAIPERTAREPARRDYPFDLIEIIEGNTDAEKIARHGPRQGTALPLNAHVCIRRNVGVSCGGSKCHALLILKTS
jgi:hypothetical protein